MRNNKIPTTKQKKYLIHSYRLFMGNYMKFKKKKALLSALTHTHTHTHPAQSITHCNHFLFPSCDWQICGRVHGPLGPLYF